MEKNKGYTIEFYYNTDMRSRIYVAGNSMTEAFNNYLTSEEGWPDLANWCDNGKGFHVKMYKSFI